MQDQLYKVEGTVENIIFRNEENGYSVAELAAEGALVTIVGEFDDLACGETMAVTGVYVSHPKYGLQLKAQTYERRLPATAAAIESYLCSGALKGIGPVIARRMVQAFGDETLTVIEQNPDRLREVEGISPKKAEKIAEEYKRIYGVRTVMVFLNQYGITPHYAIRIWKRFGIASQEILEHNPYVLCLEDIGLEFEKVDALAIGRGVQTDGYERLSACVLHVLRYNLNNGHACLPVHKLLERAAALSGSDSARMEETLDELDSRGGIVRLKADGAEYAYLPRFYEAECRIVSKLSIMIEYAQEGLPFDLPTMLDTFEQTQGIQYATLQRKAILSALQSPVMILTGGPGTGKTTTISAIIRLLGEMGQRVALAAPTGRAAKRMSELTGEPASTIHRLLEVDFADGSDTLRFKRDEKNPLAADAVIIDEMSMVDVLLFDALLRALRFSCKLILVGDPDQLPSVGAGDVLGDLIAGGVVSTVHLSEVFRQAAQSLIVTNAHAIVRGEMPRLDARDRDFFFLPDQNAARIVATTADLCARRLPTRYELSPLWDIQVLAPTRVGAGGTYELNRVLQQAINPPAPGKKEQLFGTQLLREGDKVMQVRNNYDLVWRKDNGEEGMGIFNGDIGIIELLDRPSSSLLVRYEDRIAEYAFEMAGEMELAYAVTVHKSQGNEFEAVVLPLAPGRSRMHYRNLLYTAVTRAKKLLILVGSAEVVHSMVQNHRKTRRYSNLLYLLGEVSDADGR